MVAVGFVISIAVLLFGAVVLPLLGAPSKAAYTILLSWLIYRIYRDLRMRHGPFVLRHIPSVPSIPILGPLPYIKIKSVHKSLTSWAEKLGPVFKMVTPASMVVFVSSYEAIRDVSTCKIQICMHLYYLCCCQKTPTVHVQLYAPVKVLIIWITVGDMHHTFIHKHYTKNHKIR